MLRIVSLLQTHVNYSPVAASVSEENVELLAHAHCYIQGSDRY